MPFGKSGGRFHNIAGNWAAVGTRAYATLTTAMSGANNDLTIRARDRGTGGNSIRIRIVVSGASTPLSVSVSTNDITVNSATSAGSAATSTSAQVKAAIEASTAANALVVVSHATGNDGTGTVAAFAYTALASGTNWTIGTSR